MRVCRLYSLLGLGFLVTPFLQVDLYLTIFVAPNYHKFEKVAPKNISPHITMDNIHTRCVQSSNGFSYD